MQASLLGGFLIFEVDNGLRHLQRTGLPCGETEGKVSPQPGWTEALRQTNIPPDRETDCGGVASTQKKQC